MDDIGRTLPHNLDAEKAVLGACLQTPAALDVALGLLKPDHFFRAAHHDIFEVMAEMHGRGETVDPLTLRSYIGHDRISELGGPAYIFSLTDHGAGASSVPSHAHIVTETAAYRRLIQAASAVLADAYEAEKPPGDIVAENEGALLGIAEDAAKGYRPIGDLNTEVMDTMERTEAMGGVTGVQTGFYALDEMLCGLQPGDLILVAARPSIGKAQPLDAKVLTPTGFTEMGLLNVGDRVVGVDGKPQRVIGVFDQGERQVYRVTFDDGASTECCDEHLWFTQTRNERRRGRAGSVKTLREIRGSVYHVDRFQHAIPTAQPVEFESAAQLLLDPYLLGLLLGDGGLSGSNAKWTNPEPDLQKAFQSALPVSDSALTKGAMDHHIRRTVRQHHVGSDTVRALAAMGLMGKLSSEKFVPPEYLIASIADRRAILRGLFDTDGYVYAGGRGIEYATSSSRMVNDVVFLIRSLGGTATVSHKPRPAYKHKGESRVGKPAWRVLAIFPCGWCPVTSCKHLKKWRGRPSGVRVPHRTIVKIEPTRRAECRCIAVDSPHRLYVTNDFIVTHNTAYALAMAQHIGIAENKIVAFASLEMSARALYTRMLTSEARVDAQRFRKGTLRDNEKARIGTAMAALSEARIFIDDAGGQTPTDVRAKAKRLQREHGLDVLMVDYIQLMTMRGNWQSRQQEVTAISGALKALAKELGIPIVALSQLSRATEGRKDKRPQLADLRESGALEQDADVVLMLHRPEHYDRTDDNDGIAEVIVTKQRNGPVGTVKLAFIAEQARFANLGLAGANA